MGSMVVGVHRCHVLCRFWHVVVSSISERGSHIDNQTVGRDSSVTHAHSMVIPAKGLPWEARPLQKGSGPARIAQRYWRVTQARVSWIGARQWGRDSSDAHATSRQSLITSGGRATPYRSSPHDMKSGFTFSQFHLRVTQGRGKTVGTQHMP